MFHNTDNSGQPKHYWCGRRLSFRTGYCLSQIPSWWQAMPFAGGDVSRSIPPVYSLRPPDLPSLHSPCSACPLPAGTNLGLHRLPCTLPSAAAATAGRQYRFWSLHCTSPSAYSLQSGNPHPAVCHSDRQWQRPWNQNPECG